MKKTLLAAAAAVLALPAMAHAQTPAQGTDATANVQVKARVQTYFEASKTADLDFGDLDNAGKTITPSNGARVTLVYNRATSVSVSTLTHLVGGPNGTYQLPVALACEIQNADKTAATTAGTATGSCEDFSSTLSLGDGEKRTTNYLAIGGEITAADVKDAPAGSYAGTVTVTVVNNNL